MPTSYTHKIYENYKGYTVKDFILDCADRYSGYLKNGDTTVYDESIKQYEEAIKESQAKLEIAESKTREDYIKKMVEINEAAKEHHQIPKENIELMNRYNDFIHGIRNWEAPTELHEGLRDFCYNQLLESKKWDTYTSPKPEFLDVSDPKVVDEYINDEIEWRKTLIQNDMQRLESVKKNKEEAIKWTNDLMASLEEL